MRTPVAFFLAASAALAQTGNGSIQGTVKDATGAVVPKAKVTVTHTATNREFGSETNEIGFYLFPAMQAGAYGISVEMAGMETWKGSLTLAAGQAAAIETVLKPGSTATSVTVAGDVTPLLTTTNATLSTVLERERIEQLPLNGRFITNLLYMTTPGVEAGSVPRVYGLRYATELLQDGAVLENREWQSIPARPPGLDTIAEFRSETNNSSAKFNRPGTFMITTRSGTNEWHGSLFETMRNSGFGVARARQDFYLKPPHLVRNEFGASLGGPVLLPKYDGRNRTFFFFAYEGYQLRQAATRSIAVPTPAMREGDFSGLIDVQGRRIQLYDALTTGARPDWTRLPFSNNRIPIARQTPLAKYLYSVTPLPTRDDNPLVGPNWFGPDFNNTRQHTETLRIDHKVNDGNHLFFRYSHSPARTERTNDPFGGSPTTLDRRANAFIDSQVNDSGIANWTHTFSPTFFSETLVTVARDYRGQLPFTGTEEIASGLGLPNPFKGVGFPRIPTSMSSSTGPGMAYDSSINPTINYGIIFNVDQNFTKIIGRHELQFGARVRYEKLDTLNDQQISQGQLDYANVGPTGLYDPTSGSAFAPRPLTGHTSANFFLGYGTYQARFNRSWYRPRVHERAAYIQDNFKVNSRLTLNLGLRYEYNSPVNERDRSLFGFDEQSKTMVIPRPIDDLVQQKNILPAIYDAYRNLGVKFKPRSETDLPPGLVYSNLWDFGPRAGFAYRMNTGARTIVVRGGYSLFAYPESLRLFSGQIANSMPSLGTIMNNPNAAEQSPDGLPNFLLRSAPAVIAGVNSQNALDVSRVSGITRGSGTLYYMNPRQPTARASEWNLFVEREMFRDTVLKVGYVGTHGFRMSQWYSYNDNPPDYVWFTRTRQPLPTGAFAAVARRPFDQEVYGGMQRYQKTGWSNFNGIQVEFEHRYSKGYAFQVFYVMSNALRVAGDGWRDDTLRPAAFYADGIVPADDQARNRLLYYRRDTGIPKHRVNWNFLVDLPVGKGKPVARNAGKALNALIGGWQIAGNGTLTSRYIQLPTGNWGPINGVEYYGKQYPVQDCRSGVCYDGWLAWNGYIPANRINSTDARTGRPNGVMGVPANYKPFQTPIIPIPANGGSPTDPNFGFYDTNTVLVPLANGTQQRTTFNTGLHPLQNQFMLGPMIWNMQASVFKSVALTESVYLRLNVDFLNNLFNMPGTTMPDGSGVITNRLSANSPRVLQVTMRLTW
ncbi:MAG: TonB-dependent receptor [Acidobacteria bacterium]|nr:TonB-dependent receptor [Acidobacteriota bacterium]